MSNTSEYTLEDLKIRIAIGLILFISSSVIELLIYLEDCSISNTPVFCDVLKSSSLTVIGISIIVSLIWVSLLYYLYHGLKSQNYPKVSNE